AIDVAHQLINVTVPADEVMCADGATAVGGAQRVQRLLRGILVGEVQHDQLRLADVEVLRWHPGGYRVAWRERCAGGQHRQYRINQKKTRKTRHPCGKGPIDRSPRRSREIGTAFAGLQTRTPQAARSASAMDGAGNPVPVTLKQKTAGSGSPLRGVRNDQQKIRRHVFETGSAHSASTPASRSRCRSRSSLSP